MSSVDNRIVQMEFKNAQFEKSVKGSIESIENLKKGLNLDAASKSLQGLQVTGDNFTLAGIGRGVEQLTSRFSTMGIVGMTIIHNITNAAIKMGKKIGGALLGPIIDGGKKRALAIAQAKFQFEGLGMDVKATMASALSAVKGTAYGLGDAALVASQFGASGMRAGDDMTSSLRAVAGVAAMTGREYTNIGNIFTKVAGNGRLMGGELLQLSSSGVNAAATIGKSLGKTEAQVREMVSAGEISFQIFSDAMDEAFGKHAQDANKLYTGSLANVKAALGRIGAELQAPKLDNLRDIFNALIPVIDSVHEALMPLITDFNAATKALTTKVIWSLTDVNFGPLVTILQSVQNIFKGLYSFLAPIKQAFQDIFPPATTTQLLVFTQGIKDLTAKFKVGAEHWWLFYDTFKGVFAVLDIGIYIVKGVTKALLSMVGPLLPIADGMLHVTGAIGNFLVKVNKAIKSSDIFKDSFGKLASIIGPVANVIKTALLLLAEAFNALWSSDTSDMDGFTNKVSNRFAGLNKIIGFLRQSLIDLVDFFKETFPVFGKLAGIISNAISEFWGVILKVFREGNFKALFDLVNGTLMTGLLIGINKYIFSITSIATEGGFLKNITGVFNGVRASLRLWQQELQAKILRSIAVSIGILALSLVGISMIDSGKLTSSLAAIGALLTELFASMLLMGKLAAGPGIIGTIKVIAAMQGLGIAILILAFAMEKLSKLDWGGIAKGLTSVAGLCLILVATSKLLSKASANMVQSSAGLILFAVAINMLADAVIKLAAIDMNSLIKGLGSVGILVVELGIFMKLTSGSGMGIGKSLGLIALAQAILMLSEAVSAFGALSVKELKKGLGAVGMVLGELAIFLKLTGKAKNVISTALGLMILGKAMLILAQAIGALGSMPLKELKKGLIAMAIALGTITLAVRLMPKGMIFTGIGIAIIAGALLVLADAIGVLGGMPVNELKKGLIAMAGALIIIAVAMKLMTTSLAGAAALLIVSGALRVLAEVMGTLGAMSLAQIGKSLLALVGVFAVLGLSALILTPLVPVLLALGVAVLLLGVGCLAVGAGLTLFSIGITALSVALVAGGGAIVLFITELLGLIPMALSQLGIGIIAFAKVIATAGPAIMDAIVTVLTAILNAIIKATPKIIETFFVLLTGILGAIVKAIPMIVSAIIDLVFGIIKAIVDHVGELVTAGANIIIAILEGIADKLPAIIDAAFKVIVSFINGLADAIRGNSQAIEDAVANLIDAIIGAIKSMGHRFVTAGGNAVKGFIKGLVSLPGKLWSAGVDLGKSALNAAKKALGSKSPSKEFEKLGKYSVQGFVGGLGKHTNLASKQATNMGETVISALTGAVSGISDIINGDMDSNPTIRPVLDLSNVNQGLSSAFDKNQNINVDTISSKTATISNMETRRRTSANQSIDQTPAVKGIPGANEGGGVAIAIDKFINNRAQDVQAFAEELEFYRRQTATGKGG